MCIRDRSERVAISLAPEQINRLLGQYELAPGFMLEVSLNDGQLFIQASRQDKMALFAESETVLFAREVAVTITYTFDAAGVLETCTFTQGREAYPLKKL